MGKIRSKWAIRESAPSKGKSRLGHRGHKPGNVLGKPRVRAVKVVRMYEALLSSGWHFRFKVQAISPRGFSYEADGDTAEEAFLKAFGEWRKELFTAPPKLPPPIIRPAAADLKQDAPIQEPIKQAPSQASPTLELLSEARHYPLKPLSADEKRNGQRAYARLYMRAYRDRKRLAKEQRLVAA